MAPWYCRKINCQILGDYFFHADKPFVTDFPYLIYVCKVSKNEWRDVVRGAAYKWIRVWCVTEVTGVSVLVGPAAHQSCFYSIRLCFIMAQDHISLTTNKQTNKTPDVNSFCLKRGSLTYVDSTRKVFQNVSKGKQASDGNKLFSACDKLEYIRGTC